MKKPIEKLIQGDVILIKVDKLPENVQKVDIEQLTGRLILQESEVTGHHHHFTPEADVALYQDMDYVPSNPTITPDRGRFLVVSAGGAKLFHGKGFEEKPSTTGKGDHDAFVVPPDVYRIRIVQEYDYAKREAVRVRD